MGLDAFNTVFKLRELDPMPNDGVMILVDRETQFVEFRGKVIDFAAVFVDDANEPIDGSAMIVGAHDKLVQQPIVPADRLRHLSQQLVDRR